MPDSVNSALVDLVLALLSAATLAVTAILVPWLRAKLGDQKLRTVTTLAEHIVRAVEQTNEGKAAEVKLRTALDGLAEGAKRKGINLTPDEQRALVESAVHTLRLTWASVAAPPLPSVAVSERRAATPRRKATPKAAPAVAPKPAARRRAAAKEST